jgi:hypothetical protein
VRENRYNAIPGDIGGILIFIVYAWTGWIMCVTVKINARGTAQAPPTNVRGIDRKYRLPTRFCIPAPYTRGKVPIGDLYSRIYYINKRKAYAGIAVLPGDSP